MDLEKRGQRVTLQQLLACIYDHAITCIYEHVMYFNDMNQLPEYTCQCFYTGLGCIRMSALSVYKVQISNLGTWIPPPNEFRRVLSKICD